jgi:predicted transport protein
MKEMSTLTPVQHAIREKIADIFIQFGAKSDLVCIIMSWCDTIDDDITLEMLKEYEIFKESLRHQ